MTATAQMFFVVLVDNSGYEGELLHALPHPYADRDTAVADRDVLAAVKPSDRFAAWEVWTADRVAEQHSTFAALATIATVPQSRIEMRP